VDESVHGLARVRKPLSLKAEVDEALLERELAVDRAQVVRERGDRATVEVEPTLGVASCGEEEGRPSRRCPDLLPLDRDVGARHRGEDD
jgi:hypothetical protein